MMKHYIFLTNSIRNMGGGQMYVRNKSLYLQNKGWSTSVFFYNEGPILIQELNTYKSNLIKTLAQSIALVSKDIIERTLNEIISKLPDSDEFVIESNAYHLIYWGELIAKRINAKHLLFILEENLPTFNNAIAEFFIFKLLRKEVIGNAYTYKRFLKKRYIDEFAKYGTIKDISPFCSNVIIRDSKVNFDIAYADYNILSIGRLDKPYISNMLNEFIIFVKKYSKYSFNIIFIGGDAENTISTAIRNKFKQFHNVTIYTLGYMYPIQIYYLSIADVNVASSNSVLVSANEGVPTIVVDAHDYFALGVYNYTTTNTVFRSNEPKELISDLLEDILINRNYPKTCFDNTDHNNGDFDAHMDFYDINIKKEYYDIYQIFSTFDYIKIRIIELAYYFCSGLRKICNLSTYF